MTDSLQDYLQPTYQSLTLHCSGWPFMDLRFALGTNVTEALARLCQSTVTHPGQFDVFTSESFFTNPVTSLVDLDAFNHGKSK
jgi:hypothetical protein